MIPPASDVVSTSALWRLAVEHRGLGTFSVVDGRFFQADARGRAMLGLGAALPAMVPVADVLAQLHVDDRAGFASGVQGALPGSDTIWRGEVRSTGVVPERCLAVIASGAVGILEDISEDKRMARALERAERGRDLIAGSLAHDLRAPVFNIIMAADLLSNREQTPGNQAALRRVLAAARRVNMKVEELVAFARLCIGDGLKLAPALLDLQALTARCVERATVTVSTTEPPVGARQAPSPAQASPENRPAVVVSAKGETTGTWDASMIGAALLTLIDNALRHGKPAVAHVEIDGTAANEVVVSVQNAGMIRPELIARMFELVRAPRSDVATSGGLGLGLFNARQIAFAHGGEVTVESTEASGTRFSLRLPRHVVTSPVDRRASAALEQPAPRASNEANGRGLQEQAPREYWLLLDRYTRLLEVSLHRRTFKNAGEALPDEVARLADELGALNAGARAVADLHARALRRASLMTSPTKARALVNEGRLLSLELMGNLLSYYRKRAGPPAPKGGQP